MKITKYLAAMIPALAMVFSFSSCSKDVDPEVDAKANYLFEFTIQPGSLSEEAQIALQDTIDSKIWGGVGATHYPLYSTKEYAVQSYNLAVADDAYMLNEIVNPLADEFNVLDFSIKLRVLDKDNNEIIGGKTYVPTIQRQQFAPKYEVVGSELTPAAKSQIEAKLAELYGGQYPVEVTPGYAKRIILNTPSEDLKTFVNKVADVEKIDSFGVNVSVVPAEGEQPVAIASKSYEPIYTFTKCYEIIPGSLSAEAVEELKSNMNSALFSASTIEKVTESNKTKSKQVVDFGILVAARRTAIKEALHEIADKYSVFDFKVVAKLINRENVLADEYEFDVNPKDFKTEAYTMVADVVQGTLDAETFKALNDSISNRYFDGQSSKVLGQLTVNGAPSMFNSYFDTPVRYYQSETRYRDITLGQWLPAFYSQIKGADAGVTIEIKLKNEAGEVIATRDMTKR